MLVFLLWSSLFAGSSRSGASARAAGSWHTRLLQQASCHATSRRGLPTAHAQPAAQAEEAFTEQTGTTKLSAWPSTRRAARSASQQLTSGRRAELQQAHNSSLSVAQPCTLEQITASLVQQQPGSRQQFRSCAAQVSNQLNSFTVTGHFQATAAPESHDQVQITVTQV